MQAIITLGMLIAFSLLGLYVKEAFLQLKPTIPYLLALIMLSMGLTLRGEEFYEVFRKPLRIIYAGLLQFTIMPLLGYILAILIRVDEKIMYGSVLIGSAPGGTASNVITYLSGGNLAYSVSMTTFSTLISPIMTPLLTYVLVGTRVDVPLASMVIDLLLIVLLPVVAGILIRSVFPKITHLETLLPYLAVFFIGVIIATVFAINSERLRELSMQVFILVLLHNLLGFLLGYIFAKIVGFDRTYAKTLSIEVGMQNSGLATVLALRYFPPESALPGALFSLMQNLNGLILSIIFRRL